MTPIEAVFLSKTKWYCSRAAEKWLLVGADVISMAIAFGISTILLLVKSEASIEASLKIWWMYQGSIRLQTYLVLILLTLTAFLAKGHYSKRRPYSNEIREILNIVVMLAILDAALVFFGKWQFSRLHLLFNWLLVPCILLMMRRILKAALMRAGGWIRPMVIVGWGENAIETARAFSAESLMGFNLVAFLIPEGQNKFSQKCTDRNGNVVPSISIGKNPDQTLHYLGDPHVILALEQGGFDTYPEIIQQLSRPGRDIQIVPSIRGLPLYGMEVSHLFSHEVLLLSVRNNLARRWPQLLKRGFDIVASLSALVIGSPILCWIAIKVLASGRPIFYGHKRVGRNGKPFPCYKFRTMMPNADVLLRELLANDPAAKEEWERDFKLKNDPRITPIGRFLRRTSLDELPQLWNVLKGEMSLVGPRPIVDAELERYGNQVDYYLEARPGITGLWQISGRNDITYDTRVYLDAWYVKNWSLFSDLVILFKTVKVIFKKDGAY